MEDMIVDVGARDEDREDSRGARVDVMVGVAIAIRLEAHTFIDNAFSCIDTLGGEVHRVKVGT